MASHETRILNASHLTSPHALVSMPRTAWYWLDDLVKRTYPVGGYNALMRAFGQKAHTPDTLIHDLRRKAQEHCERRMADLYGLANDNTPIAGYGELKDSPAFPETADISARMPVVFRLMHFVAHPTYLTTVWERRNYHCPRER